MATRSRRASGLATAAKVAGRGLALKVAKKGVALTVGSISARAELRRLNNDPKAPKALPGWLTAIDKPRAAIAIGGFAVSGAALALDIARNSPLVRTSLKAAAIAAGATPAGRVMKAAGLIAKVDPVRVMKVGFLVSAPQYDALGRSVARHYEAKGWDKGLGPTWKHALAIDHLPGQAAISRLPGMGWYGVDPVPHTATRASVSHFQRTYTKGPKAGTTETVRKRGS